MKSNNKFNVNIVGISEINSHAVDSYRAIHGDVINFGDITKIDSKELPEINTIVGGSPCVNFSSQGNQKGSLCVCNACGYAFDPLNNNLVADICPECNSTNINKSESALIVDWLRLFKDIRPKFAIFENVKNLLSKRFESSFKTFVKAIQDCGYNTYYENLNASDYMIPQHRERVIFLAIRKDIDNGKFQFPKPVGCMNINDLLEPFPDEFKNSNQTVFVDEHITNSVRNNILEELDLIINSTKNMQKLSKGFQSDNVVGIKYIPTLRAQNKNAIALQTCDTEQGKKYYIKQLTPREAFRFTGFSDEDYEKAAKVSSSNQIHKQAGNSIVVDVLYYTLLELFKVLPELFTDIKVIDLFAGIGAFEAALKKVVNEKNAELENQDKLSA